MIRIRLWRAMALEYFLEVINHGPAPATNVEVVDLLPAGVTFVSAVAEGGACTSGVSCLLGNMEIGESRLISITVDVDSSQTESLTNIAFVASSNPDSDSSNNQAVEYTGVILEYDLSVLKSANPDIATPGSNLTYQILVSNSGPSIAEIVDLYDFLPLPAQMGNYQISTSHGTCEFDDVNVAIDCHLGPLTAGEQATVTVIGTVSNDATGTITNRARVTCYENEIDYDECGNNTSTVNTNIVAEADLSIIKSRSASIVSSGEVFTYTLTVHNSGPSQALNVTVTDDLPTYVTFDSAIPNPSSGPDPYTWQLGSMNAGDTMVIEVVVQANPEVPDGLLVTNEASVESTTNDPYLSNNTDDVDIQVFGEADVEVIKTASTNPVKAGENLVYTITVHNYGPSTAKDVEIKDLLPDGLTFDNVSSTQGLCHGAPDIVCQLGDIQVDAEATIAIETTVDPSVPDGTEICNTATKFRGSSDPNGDNDSSEVCVDVETEFGLEG